MPNPLNAIQNGFFIIQKGANAAWKKMIDQTIDRLPVLGVGDSMTLSGKIAGELKTPKKGPLQTSVGDTAQAELGLTMKRNAGSEVQVTLSGSVLDALKLESKIIESAAKNTSFKGNFTGGFGFGGRLDINFKTQDAVMGFLKSLGDFLTGQGSASAVGNTVNTKDMGYVKGGGIGVSAIGQGKSSLDLALNQLKVGVKASGFGQLGGSVEVGLVAKYGKVWAAATLSAGNEVGYTVNGT
ncbi:MAG: hypothetical protein ACK5PF_08630, partial [bacterium]